ncbi:hypothetical protein CHS0354_040563 [Potamilus streckersoni]|uniref:Phosphatidic acid phosphatase type 2/haloperoxidase domain-containing protein n=1 Tax=Potamilus streckersoni TaxID=2493646 RepID=A0AAE0SHS0_9BIVA|nr:hypothetical protein CHS0354_040563 [Potamilus streckersoni]
MSPSKTTYRAIGIVLDVGIFLAVSTLAGLLGFNKLGINPTVRGFFCDDQSLMYPYRPDTVSTALAAILSALIPAILMAVIEGVHHYQSRQKGQGWNHLKYTTTCYKTIGVFLFGMGLTLILGEIGKLFAGRLRPHFFDVCKPDYGKIDCFRNNFSVYVNVGDQYCMGTDLSLMTDARKSFPSNHATAAFFGFTYFIIYLQVRFIWTRIYLFRPLLQAAFMGVALYIAFSRIMDHKHHLIDILGGAVLGIIVAVLTVRFVSLLPSYRNSSDGQYDIKCTDANRMYADKNIQAPLEMKEQV